MNKKRALITGITGQDGSYLAEFLLAKGYEVHGMVRHASTFNRSRVEHLLSADNPENFVILHYGDLTDDSSIFSILQTVKPDEIYNLGAQSHVRISFNLPFYTAQTVALGAMKLIESVQVLGLKTKIYQASSSEMFGKAQEVPQKETTPFYPRSPYGVSKLYAYWIGVNYREAYGMFISNGILFNHESPRRGENFVTKKIVRAVAEIAAGKRTILDLGNLDAKRDWGYAPEYVEAMWLMLQQPEPGDFVIATGETHSVREFVEEAFRLVGITDWMPYIITEERLYRPTEVDLLIGDATKAAEKLGWKPKVHFKELVRIMVEHECAELGITPTPVA